MNYTVFTVNFDAWFFPLFFTAEFTREKKSHAEIKESH